VASSLPRARRKNAAPEFIAPKKAGTAIASAIAGAGRVVTTAAQLMTNTVTKWKTVGDMKVRWAMFTFATSMLPASVTTTNRRPISAPADEPTIR
jgi:hypothetical protein